MSHRPLRVVLPERLRARAEADAARRGLPLPAWAAQTIEAHLAGVECHHGARPAEPAPEPEPAAEDD